MFNFVGISKVGTQVTVQEYKHGKKHGRGTIYDRANRSRDYRRPDYYRSAHNVMYDNDEIIEKYSMDCSEFLHLAYYSESGLAMTD